MTHSSFAPAVRSLPLVLAFVILPLTGNAAELKIAARTAALMNAQTGNILWAKDKDFPMPPASTAKVLTASVVLDQSRIEDFVTIPAEALRVSGANTQLEAGEKLTVGDLLHAMLLGSGNDAAVALALHAGNSVDTFVERMNQKARKRGAVSSRFLNPTGMPHPKQVTTAHDLALITKSAMENSDFRKIVSAKTYGWKSARWQGILQNSNHLLSTYPGAIGVKTGNTREAGYCLVAAAQRGAQTYIAVILKSQEKTVWQDAKKLLDYGFKHASLESVLPLSDR
jgi:serine-type D-Ala-D-Ala carboxypeptidase (penicillin-binding protein 5/6)